MTQNAERESMARASATVSTSFREQFRLIAVSWRWLYPLAALVGMLMLMGMHSWSYSIVAAALALIAGAVWPTILWYGETPSRRVYHWSLPVPRAAHDLMRVAVGAIYLVGIVAVLGVAGAIGDGTMHWFTAAGPQAWAGFFLTPLVAYFLMIPLALWSDYAITRRTLIGFMAFMFSAMILEQLGSDLLVRVIGWGLADGRWSFAETLTDSAAAMYRSRIGLARGDFPATDWFIGVGLWLAFGVAGTLFTARFRPDDLKRGYRTRPAAAPQLG